MRREDLPAPESGLLLTHFLTVADVPRSRAFYSEVLGGEVVLAENPAVSIGHSSRTTLDRRRWTPRRRTRRMN
ncbi:hypothetical protein STENM327S_04035 [Streptomyces tendae]